MKGSDECPRCGSHRTVTFLLRPAGAELDHGQPRREGDELRRGCKLCATLWEPFVPDDLIIADDPMSPFVRPCDNCAFRQGSHERADPQEWQQLLASVRSGAATFYCHKGVPISRDPKHSHEHPVLPDGKHDTRNMRACAGYLAQRLSGIYNEEQRQGRVPKRQTGRAVNPLPSGSAGSSPATPIPS